MTQQVINVGTAINDGTGDPVRTAFTKSNDNFTELYAGVAKQCGRLAYVSATALSFKPYNGDRIKINGAVYAIPSAGIAGLTNSGLAANTLYYVYAYNNAGTITGLFSAAGHMTSTTAGNVGTEIPGNGDNTLTLIGMVQTNASVQFQDDIANRFVISWFNRRNRSVRGANTGGTTTTATTFVELTTAARIGFLTWGEESVGLAISGSMLTNTALAFCTPTILWGGTSMMLQAATATIATASGFTAAIGVNTHDLTEGSYLMTPAGSVNSGTGTFYIYASAMIRG